MKKIIAVIMTLALLVCGAAAFAEEASTMEADGIQVNTLIEEGEFIIQLDVSDGDLMWEAYDMEQDDSVVQLAYADVLEDTFVARYSPVGDGDITVGIRHMAGPACDQYMTWDLHVEGGAVQEVLGGSHAKAPADEEIDPYLIGSWVEQETQFATMTIEKNPTRGWDLTVVSPVSHGAYVFTASVLFDCELNSLVYNKGKFWDISGDYEEGAELGEAAMAGTIGSFAVAGDEDNPTLEWYDTDRAEEAVLFVRAEEA